MAMMDKRAIVFTGTSPVAQNSPHYTIRVVKENGQTVNITSEAGTWPPRYVSTVGNAVTGIGTDGQLVEIRIRAGGEVGALRKLKLPVPQGGSWVGPYTALDARTGICGLLLTAGHRSNATYEIARISLKSGAIKQTVPIDCSVSGLFAWRDRIFILSQSGMVRAYTRKLLVAGTLSPFGGWLRAFSLSPAK